MTSDTSDAATGSSLTWRFSTNTLASKANASEVVAQPPFNAELWSPDMKRVAVALVGIDGVAQAVGVLDLATKAIRKYDVPILPNQDYRIVAGWLADSRRFLVPTPAGIAIVDADTAKWTTIPAPLAGTQYRSGTRLPVEQRHADADGRARDLRWRCLAARHEALTARPTARRARRATRAARRRASATPSRLAACCSTARRRTRSSDQRIAEDLTSRADGR